MTQEEGFTIENQAIILAVPTIILALLCTWMVRRYFSSKQANDEHDSLNIQSKRKSKLHSGSLTDSSRTKQAGVEKATTTQQQQQQQKQKKRSSTQSVDSQKSYSHPWLLTTLKAHTSPVLHLDFSSNKKYLASCAEDSSASSSNNSSSKKMSTSPKRKRNRKKKTAKSLSGSQAMLCLPRIVYYGGYYSEAFPAPMPIGCVRDRRLSDATLYHLLRNYVMTGEQLEEHGFPMEVAGQAGKAFIRQADGCHGPPPGDPSLRRCCRCHMDFPAAPPAKSGGTSIKSSDEEDEGEEEDELSEDGGGVCTYHWGKLTRGELQDGPPTYSCCSGLAGYPGCTVGAVHVSDGKCEGLIDGFVKTRPSKYAPPDGNFGVCALDCEMCYTSKGLEIARVTLIRLDGGVIYDVFVKPSAPIIDYNTRFSGLTAQDLDGVGRTLRDVQADLIYLLNRDTILVGHALENDIGLLRVLHPTVVDTAALFPHHFGLPFRRSLRALVSTYLHKEIQVGGHDSHEDARSCVELVLWKLHKDLRHIL